MDNDQLNYRLDEFFRILTQVVEQGKENSKRLENIEGDISEIKSVQKEQSQSFKRLEDKTDTIASVVVKNETRLTSVEKEVEQLRGGIH